MTTRQTVTGADQAVVLVRDGESWTWRDGQIEGDEYVSAEEALADYLSNQPEESGNYRLIADAAITTRYIRKVGGPDDQHHPGGMRPAPGAGPA